MNNSNISTGKKMKKFIFAVSSLILIIFISFLFAHFYKGSDVVSSVNTSGIFFKDSIDIKSFKDPDIDGVVCNITVTDKALSLDEQTDSSISCLVYKDKVSGDCRKNNPNIFNESKNLFFKKMKVARIYNPDYDTLTYITYVSKMKGENANHNISSIALKGQSCN